MKLKLSLASERANDRELINVDPQFVIPAVTISVRFRAFIRNVSSIHRVKSAENRCAS